LKFLLIIFQKPQDKEVFLKLNKEFEIMLEDGFESAREWDHIKGEAVELQIYPELQYSQNQRV